MARIYEEEIIPETRRIDSRLDLIGYLKTQKCLYFLNLTAYNRNATRHRLTIEAYPFSRYVLLMGGEYWNRDDGSIQYDISDVVLNSVERIDRQDNGSTLVIPGPQLTSIGQKNVLEFIKHDFNLVGDNAPQLKRNDAIPGFSDVYLSRVDYQQAEINRTSGKFIGYHENGKVRMTGEFQNGKPIGTWTWFGLDGKERYTESYKGSP